MPRLPGTFGARSKRRRTITCHRNGDGRSSQIEQLEPRLAMASMPNIIVINTDDQRFDTLEFMPTVQSQLVPNSAQFINSFVPTPICSPSRASLLTGLYAHNHGVLHVLEPWGGFENFNDSSTLATWLDGAGYNTAMIGKYINGYDLTAHANSDPNNTYVPPGWDEWRAMLGASFNSPTFSIDGLAQSFAGQYTVDVMADMADEFIRDNNDADETPFFLYFAPHNPHEPSIPAPRHDGAFDDIAPYRPPSFNEADVSDKPQWVKNQLQPLTAAQIAQGDQFRKDQLESLLSVDEGVNQMLTALSETGQLDNTIIIYTSDNGQLWGEHRFYAKGPAWDESIRVPLIIYDGRNPTAQTIDEMALNIDLAPTILQMAGIAQPQPTDGKSLVQLMNGNDAGWRDEFLIERYIGEGGKYYGIRTERYTYTEYQFTPGVELYDNLNDPYQLVSQHDNPAYATVKAELAARLDALRSADRTGPVTSNLNAVVGAGGVVTLTATVNDATTGGDEVRNAEYFVDAVGTTGLGTAMRPADGLYNSSVENMVTQISGLSPGTHTIYVHGRDLSGNWGPFVSIQVGGQTQNPSVVYRVNAGGPQLAGSPGWMADTSASPSSLSNADSGGNSAAFKVSAAINMTHPSIPAGTPMALFQDERFDKPGGAELLWDFPVTPGQYEVRLYFAENYAPLAVVGARVFDVMIEGATVLDNYDIFADVGKNKGVVKSFIVNSDGNLDVDFLRGVQNPLVSAIEILTTGQQAPSTLNSSATSLNFGNVNVGQTATKQVTLTNGGQSGQSSITIDPGQAGIAPAGSPFTVSFSQSAPIVLAPGQSTIVTVAYTPTTSGTKNASLTIPHSGGNGPLNISLTGNGVAEQSSTVLYRVNAGGPQIAGSPAWTADTAANPSQYNNAGEGGNSATFSTGAAINMSHASLPAGTPEAMFKTERYDKPSGAELLWDFAVTPGQYEVRLYFAETFSGAFASGVRVFDVSIEGVTVLNDYDVFADVGSLTAVMKSFTIDSDANLDIDFLRVKENPAIKGIEIIKLGQSQQPSPLNASDASLSFGNVDIGQTASQQVTLTNGGQSGQSSITITPSQASITPAGSPYTVSFSQAGPIVLAPGQSTIITVTYAPTSSGTKNATLAIPHNGGNSPLNISLTGNGVAVQPSTVLYRVNAGGPQIAGSPAWTADTAASPSSFNNAASGGNSATSTTAAAINMTHPTIPAGTPMAVFQSERFDKPSGANLLWDFTVTPGEYEVRLYFAETYDGTSVVGGRLFDVKIEGATVLDNYDIFADVGANKGVVKSFIVTSNSNLDIDFLRVKQNPTVRGIEILSAASGAALFTTNFSTSIAEVSAPVHSAQEMNALPVNLINRMMAAADRRSGPYASGDFPALLRDWPRRNSVSTARDRDIALEQLPTTAANRSDALELLAPRLSEAGKMKPQQRLAMAIDAAIGEFMRPALDE